MRMRMICVVIATMLPHAVLSQAPSPVQQQQEVQQSIQPAEAWSMEAVEAIRYEREVLERQADRQMQGVQDLIQLALAALGIIATAGGVLAAWFLWSTRRELRETIEKSINNQVESLIASQAGAVLDRLRVIEADIERLAGVGTRSVVWVARDDNEASGQVVTALRANGINGLSVVVPNTGGAFDIGNPELTIISYDGTGEASRRLNEALRQMQIVAPPVPLIVYTFNPAGAPHRIDGPDAEALSRYQWFVPTNFPLQLLAQVLLLLRRAPLAVTQ